MGGWWKGGKKACPSEYLIEAVFLCSLPFVDSLASAVLVLTPFFCPSFIACHAYGAASASFSLFPFRIRVSSGHTSTGNQLTAVGGGLVGGSGALVALSGGALLAPAAPPAK